MEIVKRPTPKQLNQTRNHFSRNFLCYCVSLANTLVYLAHTCNWAVKKLVKKRLNITNTETNSTIIISGKEMRCNGIIYIFFAAVIVLILIGGGELHKRRALDRFG